MSIAVSVAASAALVLMTVAAPSAWAATSQPYDSCAYMNHDGKGYQFCKLMLPPASSEAEPYNRCAYMNHDGEAYKACMSQAVLPIVSPSKARRGTPDQ